MFKVTYQSVITCAKSWTRKGDFDGKEKSKTNLSLLPMSPGGGGEKLLKGSSRSVAITEKFDWTQQCDEAGIILLPLLLNLQTPSRWLRLRTHADGEGCKNYMDFADLDSGSFSFPHLKPWEEKTHCPHSCIAWVALEQSVWSFVEGKRDVGTI